MPRLLGGFCRAQTGEKERWGGRPHTCRAGAQRPGHPHRPAFLPREDEKGAVRLVIEGFGGGDFGLPTCLSSHSATERSPLLSLPPAARLSSGPGRERTFVLEDPEMGLLRPFPPRAQHPGAGTGRWVSATSTSTEGGSAGVGREERGRGRDQTGARRRSWREGQGKTHTRENSGS